MSPSLKCLICKIRIRIILNLENYYKNQSLYGIVLVCMFSCSVVPNSVTLWTAACPTPLSIRFSWQEYWIAISSLRGYSQPRDQTISCISSGFFTAEPRASLGIVTSAECSSVPQSYPTLCDPIDCSMPGFAVHHQQLELVQTHVH